MVSGGQTNFSGTVIAETSSPEERGLVGVSGMYGE